MIVQTRHARHNELMIAESEAIARMQVLLSLALRPRTFDTANARELIGHIRASVDAIEMHIDALETHAVKAADQP